MSLSDVTHISQETYSVFCHTFSDTCISSSQFKSFRTDVFPSLESFSLFVKLYLENFQSVLPLIHTATFDLSNCHWLLTLAMASIGSHYAEIQNPELLIGSIHEFFRRTILVVVRNLYFSHSSFANSSFAAGERRYGGNRRSSPHPNQTPQLHRNDVLWR